MSIRVLLVDDNNLFRQGLSALISAHAEFAVVANLRGGREVVQAVLNGSPDIVLMDIQLAGVNGLEAVSQIKRRLPRVKVVMLTAIKSEEHVRQALRVGADGYVLKDASIDELCMALLCVSQGKKYLSPDVSGHVVHSFLHPRGSGTHASKLEMLTARERSILQLIAEGRTNRTAAEFLSVSPKTVEKHRATLMHKLGLRNVVELTLAALEMGLIERPLAVANLTASNPAGDSYMA